MELRAVFAEERDGDYFGPAVNRAVRIIPRLKDAGAVSGIWAAISTAEATF